MDLIGCQGEATSVIPHNEIMTCQYCGVMYPEEEICMCCYDLVIPQRGLEEYTIENILSRDQFNELVFVSTTKSYSKDSSTEDEYSEFDDDDLPPVLERITPIEPITENFGEPPVLKRITPIEPITENFGEPPVLKRITPIEPITEDNFGEPPVLERINDFNL